MLMIRSLHHKSKETNKEAESGTPLGSETVQLCEAMSTQARKL